ncbi:MAG: hypothetical protein JO072_01135 [Parafilimonas sp.]|nr:hypothetical protein [Parafilimonas sp.]
MNLTDWIGATGVTILLVAYFLNLMNKVSQHDFSYILMNFLGAALACCASVLLKYVPFIILEAAWTFVSLIALIKNLSRSR